MNNQVYFFVYKTTNLINGKYYIGYHQTKKIEDGYLGSGKLLKKAIVKYGPENFKREVLRFFDSKEEAEAYEAELVNKDFVLSEENYNISLGGNVCAIPGKSNPFYGKTHSQETRKKISEANKGRPGYSEYIVNVRGKLIQGIIPAAHYLNINSNHRNAMLDIIGNPEIEDIFFVNPLFQESAEKYFLRKKEIREKNLDIRRKSTSERFLNKPKSASQRANISKALKGKKKSPDHVNKINRNPSKIEKTANFHRGRTRPEETRKKMSLAKQGMVAKNKNKGFYRNPNNESEKGYFEIGKEPLGWIRGMGKRK